MKKINKHNIKVGLIGCGWIMQKAHIPIIKKLPNVEIVSLFDTNLYAVQETAIKYGIQNSFDDIDKFLNSGIDTVIIATPNYTHVKYTKRALAQGISVLCEKPVALTENEIREIINIAKDNHAYYMPGFVNRFREDIRVIYNKIKESCIGEISQIEASWIRRAGIPKPGTWFTNEEFSGGGVLIDLGSHIVDLCTLFIKDSVINNIELLTQRDYTSMTLDCASWMNRSSFIEDIQINVEKSAYGLIEYLDRTIKVKLSWAEDVPNDYTYMVIKGSKGYLELKTLFGFSNQRLWKDDELIIHIVGEKQKIVKFSKVKNNALNAFYKMDSYFINNIIERRDNYLNSEDAIRSVSLIESLYKNERNVDTMPQDFLIK